MVWVAVPAEPVTVTVLPSGSRLEPVLELVTVRVLRVAALLTVKLVVAVSPEGTFAVWGLALVTVQLAAWPESSEERRVGRELAKSTLPFVARDWLAVPAEPDTVTVWP